jgi:hypothetical protein
MRKHSQFPSPIQEIALYLTFAVVRERRINRTYDEYMAIAARLPPLKVLTFKINQFLQHLNKCSGCNGVLLPELCRFEAGHRRIGRVVSEEDFVRDGSGCTGACGNATAKVAKALTHCESKLLLPLLR